VWVYVCMCVCVCVFTCVCVCVLCVYVFVCACVCMHVSVPACARVYLCVHPHVMRCMHRLHSCWFKQIWVSIYGFYFTQTLLIYLQYFFCLVPVGSLSVGPPYMCMRKCVCACRESRMCKRVSKEGSQVESERRSVYGRQTETRQRQRQPETHTHRNRIETPTNNCPEQNTHPGNKTSLFYAELGKPQS